MYLCPVLISASRRCDIPAFRMDWLMDALRAGSCEVSNPYDARRVRRVSLAPADVDCLVLWTRDPRPLLPRVRELESMGYRFYVQVTITGYPPELEPGTMCAPEAAQAFAALSALVGPERALWRYDPAFVARGIGPEWHERNFASIAAALEGSTSRVTLSLLDEYAHTRSRLERAGFPDVSFGTARKPGACAPPKAEPMAPYPKLLARLAALARERRIEPLACAEPYDLSGLGIEAGACVDAALIKRLFGFEAAPAKDSGQRMACQCAPSVDIGEYGSCPAGCVYCYARR